MAVWLTMSLSQGIPNETTRTNTVTATVIVHYSGGSYNGNSPSGMVTIDGQSSSFSCNFNYAGIGQGAVTTGTGSVVAAITTVTVSYGSSTTKTVYASASFASGTASGTVTTSSSINLTPISSSSGGSSGGDDDDDGEGGNSGGSGSGSGDIISPLPGNSVLVGQVTLLSSTSNPSYSLSEYGKINYSTVQGNTKICIIKFETPVFEGISTSLVVNLYESSTSGVKDGAISYALCDSDVNNGMYINAPSVVDDEHQIAYGQLSKSEWKEGTFTIQSDRLNSKTNYYIVLWQHSDFPYTAGQVIPLFNLGSAGMHGITVNYIEYEKVVNIDNMSKFEKYECYISDSSEYYKYECYIDNGASWELVRLTPS